MRAVSEVHSKATAFLDALDQNRWTDTGSWRSNWVFRGQRDGEWLLAPAAWRDGGSVPLQRLARLREQFLRTHATQIETRLQQNPLTRHANASWVALAYAQARAEFTILLEFVTLADELGHRVPAIETYLRLAKHDYMPDLQSYPGVQFLPAINPAAALAQHHGVPTRSLDWTRNALFAAYFAASDVDLRRGSGNMAVWAIRPDLLLEMGRAERYNSEYTRFLHSEVPNSENPYLQSQEGLFIHPIYGCAHIARTGTFPDFEDFAVTAQNEFGITAIRKLELPHSEAGELLRLLWLRRVSRAHLMPTIDNITQALGTRWKWEE